MSYCPRCGIKLPEDARFCPNCGASIYRIVKPRAAEIHLTGSLKSRALIFLAVYILCISITLIGASARIERREADEIMKEMNKLENTIKSAGVQIIFGNNFIHALIMFIPAVGPCWGAYILYNTGRVFAAYSLIYNVDPTVLFLTIFIYPFAWMEYLAYTLAMSESLWVVYAALKRNFKNEIIIASVIIAICSVILLLAALIETALITPI
jgi:hypothetical protein